MAMGVAERDCGNRGAVSTSESGFGRGAGNGSPCGERSIGEGSGDEYGPNMRRGDGMEGADAALERAARRGTCGGAGMLKRILCVDDDIRILQAFERQFRKQFELQTAAGPLAALNLI